MALDGSWIVGGNMNTYEWLRVVLALLHVLVTVAVPFVMIYLERKYGIGMKRKDD